MDNPFRFRQVLCVVMDQGTEKWCCGWRPPDSRAAKKLEAYHQSRQPQSFFLCGLRCSGTSDRCSGRCGVIFLRAVAAAVSSSRRCGDFCLVSRHKPAEHRFLMFPLFPTLRRRVSHAGVRLRNQRFFTRRGAAARSTPLCPSDVASMSWPDRGHHVPALAVQAVGGVSGLTWHAAMFPQQSGSFGGHPRVSH